MKDTSEERRAALRRLPYMGVIAVVAEAEKLGFVNGDPTWINLGQGQPEVGPMAGAPPRFEKLEFQPIDHAYGPVHGVPELRARVAEHYNRLYRQGKHSHYGPDNVAIASGGRLALSRAAFSLAPCRIGYLVPDYSAYEDMLYGQMPRVEPVPLRAREEDGFALTPELLEMAIDRDDLGAFLISNPCNPTGVMVKGPALERWVELARERNCVLLSDEFYSQFHYLPDGRPAEAGVSAASAIDDVEVDPVLIFDGLTKCFRYPGWRLGWVLGPKSLIECFITTGSALDGGPARIIQRGAMEVLESDRADQELNALRLGFAAKRNLMVERLRRMGIRFARESEGTFYLWGALDRLPAPFDQAAHFFHRALQRKVLTVPGYYFDVDPGRRRQDTGDFDHWMRFSFGPPIEAVREGLDRLEAMLREEAGLR
ncbi:MAG: pyridoxal phosphate-dependent aminotransferase [Planctomycetes bacterium]|nr:pyridoxal phosphate-dependent aminotransferase [Planctomycetota bacterium]